LRTGKIEKRCAANAIKEMVLFKHHQLMDHLGKQANSGQFFTMNYSPCSIGTQRSQNAKLGVNQDAISHSSCLALPLTLLSEKLYMDDAEIAKLKSSMPKCLGFCWQHNSHK